MIDLVRISLVSAALAAVVPAGAAMAAEAGGCSVNVSSAWSPVRGKTYRVEAFSNGPSCEKAVATLVVRSADGSPILAVASPSSQVMVLAGMKTRKQMEAALTDWMRQNHPFRSSANFPVWKRGAAAPTGTGEFPFYPDRDVDQQYYEQVRGLRLPVFCYVQGMESIGCYVLRDGGLVRIGVQSFPG